MAGKNSWLLPLIAGIGIGWMFSGTINRVVGPIAGNFGLKGGNTAYAYQNTIDPAIEPTIPPFERRSFSRAYDSWLHGTVNSLPTIG